MGTVKRTGRCHRDAVAGESVPPRRHSPPIATKTDESVAPHCAALRRSMLQRQAWTLQSREDEHTYAHYCSIQERCRPYFLWLSKQKTYNMKVVWNSMVKLLSKENSKRRLVCDEFDQIWSNWFQTKLKLTPNETRNGWLEWIHLIEVHLFHVEHIFQRSMVVIL
jgi:hypothetical protein